MVEADHHAQIMDFGISRSSRAAAMASGEHPPGDPPPAAPTLDQAAPTGVTMAGVVIGSLPYMAPEQARGMKVDHRADIYSFGLILRDLLVGRRRHAGQSAVDEMLKRIVEAPAGPRSVDPAIPEALDRLVRRCLDPDPAARHQSTQELVADLDRLDAQGNPRPEPDRITRRQALAALAVVAFLLGTTWWLARNPGAAPAHEPVSVLIADVLWVPGRQAAGGLVLRLAQDVAANPEGFSSRGLARRTD
jgi:serine/threonine protein kinase